MHDWANHDCFSCMKDFRMDHAVTQDSYVHFLNFKVYFQETLHEHFRETLSDVKQALLASKPAQFEGKRFFVKTKNPVTNWQETKYFLLLGRFLSKFYF